MIERIRKRTADAHVGAGEAWRALENALEEFRAALAYWLVFVVLGLVNENTAHYILDAALLRFDPDPMPVPDWPRGCAPRTLPAPNGGRLAGEEANDRGLDHLDQMIARRPPMPETEETRTANQPARICRQCQHPAGWHPLQGSRSARAGAGCLECSCELDMGQALAHWSPKAQRELRISKGNAPASEMLPPPPAAVVDAIRDVQRAGANAIAAAEDAAIRSPDAELKARNQAAVDTWEALGARIAMRRGSGAPEWIPDYDDLSWSRIESARNEAITRAFFLVGPVTIMASSPPRVSFSFTCAYGVTWFVVQEWTARQKRQHFQACVYQLARGDRYKPLCADCRVLLGADSDICPSHCRNAQGSLF